MRMTKRFFEIGEPDFVVGLQCRRKPFTYNSRGIADDDRELGNIPRHDGARADDGSCADGDSAEDGHGRTDPHVVTDRDTVAGQLITFADPSAEQHRNAELLSCVVGSTNDANTGTGHQEIADRAIDLNAGPGADCAVVTYDEPVGRPDE
jgi:hypothetical protein